MKETIITTSPEEAAAFIKSGGIVAFGTETVYGLGANVFDKVAIAKIFVAKQRPPDNPLIAHISDLRQLAELVTEITESAQKFIDAFFPGPLTIVLKKQDRIPMNATAGLDTIGVRMPILDSARQFLRSCEVPIVAPSANISGRPSPTTWQAVLEDLDGRIDCILRGEPTAIGLESTVVDCSGYTPVLLRAGSITLDQLISVVPETIGISELEGEAPKSPGIKHRHYSPQAKVILIDNVFAFDRHDLNGPANAFIGLTTPPAFFRLARLCDSIEEYAHDVFEFFRECDRSEIETIYCEMVDETGLGVALTDRLRRASKG